MYIKSHILPAAQTKNKKLSIIILFCIVSLLFQGCLASPEKFQARLDKLSLLDTFSEIRWPGGGYFQYYEPSKTDDPYIFEIQVMNHPGGAYPDSEGDIYRLNLRYITPVHPSAIVIGSDNSCAITYTSAGTDGIIRYDLDSSVWASEESIQFLADWYGDPFYDKAIILALATKMNQAIAEVTGLIPEPVVATATVPVESASATATVPVESASATAHFDLWGLSFDYPAEWVESPASEVTQMKDYLAGELHTIGRDLLEFTIIVGPTNETALMISKYQTPTPMTAVEFIQERNDVYTEAMKTGDVTRVNYIRETTMANLPAVEEDVERSNGGRGLTWKIIDGRTIFEITFIVHDATKFPQYSEALSQILSTIELVTQ